MYNIIHVTQFDTLNIYKKNNLKLKDDKKK